MSTVSLRSSHASLAWLGPRGRSTWQIRLAGAADLMLTWYERARQRRQLRALSDHMLRDMGLGRVDVEAEAEKPFWRP